MAGGYAKAVEHAKAAGCDALQIFSSNPRSYRPSAINGPALDAFAQMRRDAEPRSVRDSHAVSHQFGKRRSEDLLPARCACCEATSRSRRAAACGW